MEFPSIPAFRHIAFKLPGWAISRRRFPFGFARQTTTGPSAPSISLEPAHVTNRMIWRQRSFRVEITHPPVAVVAASPIDGMHRLNFFTPAPARVAPVTLVGIAAVFDEVAERRIRHRGSCNLKRHNFDHMPELLVIEDERSVRTRTELDLAARYIGIPR